MSTSHAIRLRGPWQYEPLARTVWRSTGTTFVETGPLPAAGVCAVPSDWSEILGADFRGRVRYLRRFGRPTGLATGDRVDLVVEQIDAFGSLALNGVLLGEIPPGQMNTRVDVTELLKSRNLLAIEVELPWIPPDCSALSRGGREGLPGGLVGEVRLEIHAADLAAPRQDTAQRSR